MAETTPTREPETVTAGNTWTWTKTLASYAPTESGGTWTLSYAIAGEKALVWSSSYVATSGSTWTVTIPASVTATLPAGRYQWAAIVTGGSGYAGQRYTPETGTFTVLANPAELGDGDALRFAEKQLEAVEAVLANRITADLQSYTIAGQSIMAIPVERLMAIRNQLRVEVWRMRNPGKVAPVRRIAFVSR